MFNPGALFIPLLLYPNDTSEAANNNQNKTVHSARSAVRPFDMLVTSNRRCERIEGFAHRLRVARISLASLFIYLILHLTAAVCGLFNRKCFPCCSKGFPFFPRFDFPLSVFIYLINEWMNEKIADKINILFIK